MGRRAGGERTKSRDHKVPKSRDNEFYVEMCRGDMIIRYGKSHCSCKHSQRACLDTMTNGIPRASCRLGVLVIQNRILKSKQYVLHWNSPFTAPSTASLSSA